MSETMSDDNDSKVTKGMIGSDNGNDFKVVRVRPGEVKIEYFAQGREAWFARNRFGRQNGQLRLW